MFLLIYPTTTPSNKKSSIQKTITQSKTFKKSVLPLDKQKPSLLKTQSTGNKPVSTDNKYPTVKALLSNKAASIPKVTPLVQDSPLTGVLPDIPDTSSEIPPRPQKKRSASRTPSAVNKQPVQRKKPGKKRRTMRQPRKLLIVQEKQVKLCKAEVLVISDFDSYTSSSVKFIKPKRSYTGDAGVSIYLDMLVQLNYPKSIPHPPIYTPQKAKWVEMERDFELGFNLWFTKGRQFLHRRNVIPKLCYTAHLDHQIDVSTPIAPIILDVDHNYVVTNQELSVLPPFPQELNRHLFDHVSEMSKVKPTPHAVADCTKPALLISFSYIPLVLCKHLHYLDLEKKLAFSRSPSGTFCILFFTANDKHRAFLNAYNKFHLK